MDIKEAFEASAETNSGIKEILNEVKLINISKEDVFDATRRAYIDTLGELTDSEIIEYFALYDQEGIARHVYNIKGYVLEQEVEQQLISEGYNASLYETINHPNTDITVGNGEIIEYQIKATDIENTTNDAMVHNTGIKDEALEELVSDAISPFPISIPGLLVRSALAAFGIFSF